jgi:hypothetical protein
MSRSACRLPPAACRLLAGRAVLAADFAYYPRLSDEVRVARLSVELKRPGRYVTVPEPSGAKPSIVARRLL